MRVFVVVSGFLIVWTLILSPIVSAQIIIPGQSHTLPTGSSTTDPSPTSAISPTPSSLPTPTDSLAPSSTLTPTTRVATESSRLATSEAKQDASAAATLLASPSATLTIPSMTSVPLPSITGVPDQIDEAGLYERLENSIVMFFGYQPDDEDANALRSMVRLVSGIYIFIDISILGIIAWLVWNIKKKR